MGGPCSNIWCISFFPLWYLWGPTFHDTAFSTVFVEMEPAIRRFISQPSWSLFSVLVVLMYISLFLQVLGWWVCVCLYTHINTHKLLWYLMYAQVWDGHLASQKNPDRLKRIIHVEHIGVHSTFVYMYAVLRVLMIWANCFFLLTCLFFGNSREKWRKCISVTVSLRGRAQVRPSKPAAQHIYRPAPTRMIG